MTESVAPDVAVRLCEHGRWRAWCSCGWAGPSEPGTPVGRDDATRNGATRLYRDHGIYAGGHKPTMAAMEAPA